MAPIPSPSGPDSGSPTPPSPSATSLAKDNAMIFSIAIGIGGVAALSIFGAAYYLVRWHRHRHRRQAEIQRVGPGGHPMTDIEAAVARAAAAPRDYVARMQVDAAEAAELRRAALLAAAASGGAPPPRQVVGTAPGTADGSAPELLSATKQPAAAAAASEPAE